MKIKRRTKIISQTERQFSIALKRQPVRFFCASCGEQAEMLSINEATKRCNTTWREIVRLIETGEIHSGEIGGEIFICAASIKKGKDSNEK